MPVPFRNGVQEALAHLLPHELLPLFDDRFVRSCDLVEAYVDRLAFGVFRATGVESACALAGTAEEAIARAGLRPDVAAVPVAWMLRTLAARGWVVRTDDGRFRAVAGLEVPDPAELIEEQTAHDPRCLPAFRIAALAAERYPAVLRGETSGEHALFGPDTLDAWIAYFSNGNPLYAINNAVGAMAAERALHQGAARVLELGGGLGSGAEALLQRLDASGRAGQVALYRLTEVVPQFLRRAKKSLSARHAGMPLEFGWLDIDAAPADMGRVEGGWSLVYGVNVLHAARDLAATLQAIRVSLAEGGALVLAECVRPFVDRPVYVEFMFNLLEAFRAPLRVPGWRPSGGFLTPEQWTDALRANGFERVTVFPNIGAIRDVYPSFVVAAITAHRT
jgi:SAM-dependent methyltransferase